ncbi:two-component sensor histidine kinase [Longispora fulva]|uniref:histidine kinase n=1 Tax=Longispora fulva TaxID=619741 RepID=A0A8J7KWS3_9ACTN|nr:histidine kinase [Longispora fulva]MBG6136892.1 signal transduction histidine kinase [Longispora fulva]GIG60063.1 two-component sensor histidine kinase [Longispora fulva]
MRRDLLTSGFVAAGGFGLWMLGAYDLRLGPSWSLLAPLAVMAVAVGLGRVAPVTAVLLGTVAAAADQALGPSLATVLAFTQVLYDATVHGPRRLPRLLLWTGAAVAAGTAVVAVAVTGDIRASLVGLTSALVLVLPVESGVIVRQHRDEAAAERDRTAQVARLAELDHRQAVHAERSRMARELHDVVANHLSVIALHATGGLALPAADPEATRRVLGVVRENAVAGLAEMRHLVAVLREEPGDLVVPGLGGLPALLDRAGATLRTSGTVRRVPVAVDFAAYRIVQESLTNALKHAGTPPTVTVTYEPDAVRVEVDNPLGASSGVPSGGAGLVGMRERATLLGATFEAGPEGGAWRVLVRLPT